MKNPLCLFSAHIKSVLIGGGVDAEGAGNCLLPSYGNRYLIHQANGSCCGPQIFRAQQPTLQKNIQFQLASRALAKAIAAPLFAKLKASRYLFPCFLLF